MTIPANIDYVGVLNDLNRWGVTDYKVELICGFASGYLSHLRDGNYRDMTYQRAARLYNFWHDECRARGAAIPWSVFPEKNQQVALST